MERKFLIENYKTEITEIINAMKKMQALSVSLKLLKDKNDVLYNEINSNFISTKWNTALLEAQREIIETEYLFLEDGHSVKLKCYVHFINLPLEDDILKGQFPNKMIHFCKLIQITGTVIKMSKVHNYQYKKVLTCNKCKESKIIETTFEDGYIFSSKNLKCKNRANNCRGFMFPEAKIQPDFLRKYQKCKLQEANFKDLTNAKYIVISLEESLVESSEVGEHITICGFYEPQFGPMMVRNKKKIDMGFYLRAVGVERDETKMNFQKHFAEQLMSVKMQFQEDIIQMNEFNARNSLINSICPQIQDLSFVKLALALALSSGQISSIDAEFKKRSHSHLLLIGDPGVGKSKFLEAVSDITFRCASTTGIGSTSAGLTAACVQEGGSYHLEAGALVLADNGVCCIDEFNLMQDHDRAVIHEALEQQEINIAKGGIVKKLNTRCVVVCAANPKGMRTKRDQEAVTPSNVGIASPLLSRMDLVLVLKNEINPDLDHEICLLKLNMSINDNLWSSDRLKIHFLACREIEPIISDSAQHVILNYYLFCRSDPDRDKARTTIRLQDSLNRLAQSHARLSFRHNVLGCDALLAVKLNELSYGFGRLLPSKPVMNKLTDIGPTLEDIEKILAALKLEELKNELENEFDKLNKQDQKEKTLNINTDLELHFQTQFGFRKEKIPLREKNNQNYPMENDVFSLLHLIDDENKSENLHTEKKGLAQTRTNDEHEDVFNLFHNLDPEPRQQSRDIYFHGTQESYEISPKKKNNRNAFSQWDNINLDLDFEKLSQVQNRLQNNKITRNSELDQYITEICPAKKIKNDYGSSKNSIYLNENVTKNESSAFESVSPTTAKPNILQKKSTPLFNFSLTQEERNSNKCLPSCSTDGHTNNSKNFSDPNLLWNDDDFIIDFEKLGEIEKRISNTQN